MKKTYRYPRNSQGPNRPGTKASYFLSFFAGWDNKWSSRASFRFVRLRRGHIRLHFPGIIYERDLHHGPARWICRPSPDTRPELSLHCSEDFESRFPELLADWRKQRGLSLRQAGRLLGLRPQHLCSLEKGHRRAGPRTRKRLSEVIGGQSSATHGPPHWQGGGQAPQECSSRDAFPGSLQNQDKERKPLSSVEILDMAYWNKKKRTLRTAES